MSHHPEGKWAERDDKVYFTLELPNPIVSPVYMKLDREGIFTFSAKAGPEKLTYDLRLELNDNVKMKESIYKMTLTSIICIFEKAEPKLWNKLLRGGKSHPHVKADWEECVDKDEDIRAGDGDMDYKSFGMEEQVLYKLRLIVDKKNQSVILAECDQFFVQALCTLLSLPMATLVRLMEQDSTTVGVNQPLGCFHTLYKSVRTLDDSIFSSDKYKALLLHPLYSKMDKCRNSMALLDENHRALKYYICPNSLKDVSPCSRLRMAVSSLVGYAQKCPEKCPTCPGSLDKEVKEKWMPRPDIFSSSSTFTITEDMHVVPTSTDFTLDTLRQHGHQDYQSLEDQSLDVTRSQVLSLFRCILCSESPLTEVFLNKKKFCLRAGPTSERMPRSYPAVPNSLRLTLFADSDSNVKFCECTDAFANMVLLMLALPLELVWAETGKSLKAGCIDHLASSLKLLCISEDPAEATYQSTLHYVYDNMASTLLDVVPDPSLAANVSVKPNPENKSGFVKPGQVYIVTRDLTVKSLNTSSCAVNIMESLSNFKTSKSHRVEINKQEAFALLYASLTSENPLTAAFGHLIKKTPE